MLEPTARNTAAAIAAACFVREHDGDAVLAVMPADHHIGGGERFAEALACAAEAARRDHIVTLGLVPTRREIGYGYMEAGAPLDANTPARRVVRFIEKPDIEAVQQCLASGRHLWNSGIFVFRAPTMIAALRRHAPEVARFAEMSVTRGRRDGLALQLDEVFAECPSISIDYAVIEKSERLAVVPAAFEWADLGSWDAVWSASPIRDGQDNVVAGDIVCLDAGRNYIRTTKPTVVIGTDNLAIVEGKEGLLVAAMERAQDVRIAARTLPQDAAIDHGPGKAMERPWGSYATLDRGAGFRVKRLSVKPKAALSLQSHRHRAEWWCVVRGTAAVTLNGRRALLREGETAAIPADAVHRLENPGEADLEVIEIQLGSYLGEDDIDRQEDRYGRNG